MLAKPLQSGRSAVDCKNVESFSLESHSNDVPNVPVVVNDEY